MLNSSLDLNYNILDLQNIFRNYQFKLSKYNNSEIELQKLSIPNT